MVEIKLLKSIIPRQDWTVRNPFLSDLLQTIRRRRRVILAHTAIWVLYLFFNNLLIYHADLRQVTVLRTLFTYPLVALLFYANAYWVVTPQAVHKQYVRIVLYTVLLLATFVGLRYSLFTLLFPRLGLVSEYSSMSNMFDKFLPDSIWIAFEYLLFSYGYWFAIHTVALERQKQRMQQDLLQLGQAKAQSELAFLRAQLNPHFMFNTLNFFYSEAMTTAPRLANGILDLATMMRAVTELSSKSMVTIQHELDYIHNYMSLQQLRFGSNMHLTLTVEGKEHARYLYLPPLVLISLIENIFKYADLSDAAHPARVSIQLDDDTLHYQSYNLKKETPAYVQGGMGMKNIEDQLRILYGNEYNSVVNDTLTEYSVFINIYFSGN